LRLPLPRQSILISVGHVPVDLQVLSTISLQVIRFNPFAQHGPPTSVFWILSHELYLVHCKAVLIFRCIPSATTLPRILDHIFCEGCSFRRYSVFFILLFRSPGFCSVC
jgi:hypothetical protein